MTVTERTGERDTYSRQDFGLIFPWRAVHDEEDAHPCHFSGVFYTQAEAEHALATHTCPTPARKQYTGMSIAEQYWVELDRVIDEIKDTHITEQSDSDFFKLQGRASGLAFAIVQACQPYYDDERAVSIEANRRYKMRNGQVDWQPTPGFKYDPPVPGTNPRTVSVDEMATYTQPHNRASDPNATAPTSGRRRRAAATPVEKQLTDVEKETIRKTGGAFPAKDLAKMYGVSEATIKALVGTS